MKKTALILAAVFLSASLPAQTTPLEIEQTTSSAWVLTNTVVTQYMFRGTRLGGLSYQPTLEYDAGGLGLGIWANIPLKDKVHGQSDPELDFYGFYPIQIARNIS